MTYKVVKEFDSLKKGNLLTNSNEEPDIYVFEEETENRYVYVSYSTDIIDELEEKGYLIEIPDEDEENECTCNCVDVIQSTIAEIDSLLEQYKKDNDEVNEKFANGELPYCAKVEADTVHTNLTKVLTHIKSMLTEDEQTC